MIDTVGARLQLHAFTYPNQAAVVQLETGESLSYSELNKAIDSCVSWLLDAGIRPRRILALVADNSIATLTIYLACLRAGIIVNPYPTTIEPVELEKYLQLFDVEHLVFPDESKFASILENVPGSHSYKSGTFVQNLIRDMRTSESVDSCPNSPACMYYSSGTTGSPKGILYSYRNIEALIESMVEGFEFKASDKHLVMLPLGHTAAINYSVLPSIWAGSTLFLASSFWAIRGQFWELVQKHQITYVQTVPTILFALSHMPVPKEKPSGLEWIGCGSAPLPMTVQENFQKLTGIPVGNLYGHSESGPSHIDHPLRAGWVPGSIGEPLSCNSCQILDDDGNPVNDGILGEIALKGDNIFIGYYKNPSAYRSAVVDSYFRTGDIGYRDSNGRYFFQDRKKDLIIQGGVNIFPGEVEEILMEIHWILEAVVVGIPDPVLGQKIAAYVVPTSRAHDADHESILAHCRHRLSETKVPSKIIFVDNLPKGPSGKILKRRLRDHN